MKVKLMVNGRWIEREVTPDLTLLKFEPLLGSEMN